MLVSVPLYLDDLPGRPTGADLRDTLSAFYEGSEHVTVADGSGMDKLEPEALNGTDRLDLYVRANESRGHAVCALDIVKQNGRVAGRVEPRERARTLG